MAIDYRLLLQKYMGHVATHGGQCYIGHHYAPTCGISDAEWAALVLAYEDYYNDAAQDEAEVTP